MAKVSPRLSWLRTWCRALRHVSACIVSLCRAWLCGEPRRAPLWGSHDAEGALWEAYAISRCGDVDARVACAVPHCASLHQSVNNIWLCVTQTVTCVDLFLLFLCEKKSKRWKDAGPSRPVPLPKRKRLTDRPYCKAVSRAARARRRRPPARADGTRSAKAKPSHRLVSRLAR